MKTARTTFKTIIVSGILAATVVIDVSAEVLHLADLLRESDIRLGSSYDYPLNITRGKPPKGEAGEWQEARLKARWVFVGKWGASGVELWQAECPGFHLHGGNVSTYFRLLRDGEELAYIAAMGEGGRPAPGLYTISSRTLTVSKQDSGGKTPPSGRFAFKYLSIQVFVKSWEKAKQFDEGKIGKLEMVRQWMGMGGDFRQALVVPGISEISFSLPLDADQRLCLSVAIGPASWEKSGDGVCFAVYLNGRGDGHRVFEKYIDSRVKPASRMWHDAEIDLTAYRHLLRFGKDELVLVTEPSERQSGKQDTWFDYACWGDVHLYRPAAKESRPNIILIFFDALRADRVGCYGYKRDTTPNLDAFATEATLFERCYSAAPWTLASFKSTFTGVYPRYFALGEKISPDHVTLGEVMQEAGYYNAAFTGLPYLKYEYGFGRGFSRYFNFSDMKARGIFEKACRFLEKKKDVNFCLFLHCNTPHATYIGWPEFRKKFKVPEKRGRVGVSFEGHEVLACHEKRLKLDAAEKRQVKDLYDCNVAFGDYHFAALMDKLRELGLLERSLVIVTSDHGEEFWDHGGTGHGAHLYEESIRVPLLVRYPGDGTARRDKRLVSLVDLMPTLIDYLGISPGNRTHGESWLKSSKRRQIIAEWTTMGGAKNAVIEERYKYIIHQSTDEGELYDLAKDRRERKNIVGRLGEKEKAESLRRVLKERERTARSEWQVMFVNERGVSDYRLRLVAEGKLTKQPPQMTGDVEMQRLAPGSTEVRFRRSGRDGFSFVPDPPDAKLSVSLLVDGLPRPELLFAGGKAEFLPRQPFSFSARVEESPFDAVVDPDFNKDGVFIWRRLHRADFSGSGVRYSAEELKRMKSLGYLH